MLTFTPPVVGPELKVRNEVILRVNACLIFCYAQLIVVKLEKFTLRHHLLDYVLNPLDVSNMLSTYVASTPEVQAGALSLVWSSVHAGNIQLEAQTARQLQILSNALLAKLMERSLIDQSVEKAEREAADKLMAEEKAEREAAEKLMAETTGAAEERRKVELEVEDPGKRKEDPANLRKDES
jgi:hypothetical protein